MGDNFVDNLENDYNELNDDSNLIINDNNVSDDTTSESSSLKNGVKLLTLTNH